MRIELGPTGGIQHDHGRIAEGLEADHPVTGGSRCTSHLVRRDRLASCVERPS
jgi:hypothetical protein